MNLALWTENWPAQDEELASPYRRKVLATWVGWTWAAALWNLAWVIWGWGGHDEHDVHLHVDDTTSRLRKTLEENGIGQEAQDKIIHDFEAWDHVALAWHKEKHGELLFQIALDLGAMYIFGKEILPRFFSWEGAESMSITLTTIGTWYALSDEKSREHWNHEMQEAWKGTALMMTIVSMSEGVSFDVESQMWARTEEHFAEAIWEYKNEDNKVYQTMASLGFDFISEEDERSEESRNVFAKNGKICISNQVFIELLPYFITSSKHEEIFSRIQQYVIKPDLKEIEGVFNIWLQRTQENPIQIEWWDREYQLERVANIFMYELWEIISFVLTNQLIFGLGQVTLIKEKIVAMGGKIELLALANGKTNEDAAKLSERFVSSSISYLPNRFAWTSDLGPLTAALQKDGVNGVFQMINSVWPIVLTNISPYYSMVKSQVLEGMGLRSSAIKIDSSLASIFKKTFQENMKTFLRGPLELGKTLWEGLGGASNILDSLGWNTGEQVQARNRAQTFTDHRMRSFLKESEAYPVDTITESDYTQYVQTCSELIDDIASKWDMTANIDSPTWITNIIHVIQVLSYIHGMSATSQQSIYTIFQKHTAFFVSLWKAVHTLAHHNYVKDMWAVGVSPDDFALAYEENTHDVIDFLGSIVNIPSSLSHNSHDDENLSQAEKEIQEKESRNSEIHKQLQDNWKIEWILGVGIEDYELITNENTFKDGSIRALGWALAKNISLLSYIYDQDNAFAEKYIQTFIQNLVFIEWESAQRNSEGIWSISKSLAFFIQKLSPVELTFFQSICDENDDSTIQSLGASIKVIQENLEASKAEPQEEKKKRMMGFFKAIGLTNFLDSSLTTIEHTLWENSFEVLNMVFMVQSPYVIPIRQSVERAVKAAEGMSPQAIETIIASAVYGISMFADNYVGLVVGVGLAQELLWIEPGEAIKKFAKFAIIGWSKVVTGNSPNALFDRSKRSDFYFSPDLNPNDPEARIYKKYDAVFNTLWEIHELLEPIEEEEILKSFMDDEDEEIKWLYGMLEEQVETCVSRSQLSHARELISAIKESEEDTWENIQNLKSFLQTRMVEEIFEWNSWVWEGVCKVSPYLWEALIDILSMKLMPAMTDLPSHIPQALAAGAVQTISPTRIAWAASPVVWSTMQSITWWIQKALLKK